MDIDVVYRENRGLLTPEELEAHMAREDGIRAFWKSLASSLLRNKDITRPSPIGNVYPIFCLNCGCPQGAVTQAAVDNGAVCLCRSCAATHGGLPLPEVPDALIRPRREE